MHVVLCHSVVIGSPCWCWGRAGTGRRDRANDSHLLQTSGDTSRSSRPGCVFYYVYGLLCLCGIALRQLCMQFVLRPSVSGTPEFGGDLCYLSTHGHSACLHTV